jgi:hypothetical protein
MSKMLVMTGGPGVGKTTIVKDVAYSPTLTGQAHRPKPPPNCKSPLVTQHCTDAATDKLMNAFGGEMSAGRCSKREMQKAGATIIINAVCQVEPIKWVSQTVIWGDFNSHYTVRMTSKVEGLPKSWEPLWALAVGPYTMQARWIGACKADQLPGDIILADGSKTNIKELFK